MEYANSSPRFVTFTQFFVPMVPPTITHQQHRIATPRTGPHAGKPVVYDSPELKAAKAALSAHLAKAYAEARTPDGYHIASLPPLADVPVRLTVKWCFPRGDHPDGAYRITRPDTDNLVKALKDIMTRIGFWNDDAIVASEIVEKFWASIPGIFIHIQILA